MPNLDQGINFVDGN